MESYGYRCGCGDPSRDPKLCVACQAASACLRADGTRISRVCVAAVSSGCCNLHLGSCDDFCAGQDGGSGPVVSPAIAWRFMFGQG